MSEIIVKIIEEPKFVHGRLAEATHNAGYSFERACRELEWLLEDERWKACGQGFEKIDNFLSTIDFSEFKIAVEQRKKLAKKLADLRATQRVTANVLGVGSMTVNRDIKSVPNGTKESSILPIKDDKIVPNDTPVFQHSAKDAVELLDKKTSGIAKDAEKVKRQLENENKYDSEKSDEWDIRHGSYQEYRFEDNTIDHIFTDPPYPEKYLSEWEYLAQEAIRILKPGGFCICYSGTFNLIKVMQILSKHLEYYWQCVLLHIGGNQFINARNLNTGYKPILIFQKPPMRKTDTAFLDIFKGSGKEKDNHKWQQAEQEAIEIIGKLTKPNDLILDPFAGSGTIPVACHLSKRRFIAIEKEKKYISKIYTRLNKCKNNEKEV